MKIHFYKYQGAGNDFILADNRSNTINHHNPGLIAGLCDRRFGVGGDGMMFLQNSEGFDFEMVYYNADGQPSSMCGNIIPSPPMRKRRSHKAEIKAGLW